MASPRLLDPLIGRDDDLRALIDLLDRAPLVTLTGAGGSGKTRLADAAVAHLRERGAEAWFVDCSATEDVSILGATIAAALDLQGSKGMDPMDLVIGALKDHEAVLALDNLEQLEGAGLAVARLLKMVPGLTIIATSRLPLRVKGEVESPVLPLGLPDSDRAASVMSSPAGALFMQRALGLMSSRELDEATAVDVATLLRRLDGLPLAIELAAARTRAMSPREINRRLDERGLEGIDSHIGDGRRSLHSIIDWTVGQLSPREREALDAVSVCAGFDLALVQSLLPATDVVPAIESLMALGLVHRVETNTDTTRFRLLETIRSAVMLQLLPGQEIAFRQLHASHFLRIAETWERAVATGATGGLSGSFDADADNVRRALDYLETADPSQGLVLLARLSLFWKSRGRFREGYERFQRAAKSAVEPSVELVRAALEQVQFIWMAMPLREQRALLERTLEMARAVGDQDAIEETLRMSAVVELNANETPRLLAIAAELEAIASEDDLESRLRLMNVRVHVAQAVDGRTSDRYVDMQRAYVGAMQDAGRDLALIEGVTLAGSLFGRGEYEESLRLARAAVAAFQDLGREAEAGWAMAYVGPALAESGRTPEAIDAVLECASIALQTGHAQNIGDALWAAMPVALAAGKPELVARLYGAIVRGMHARGEIVLVRFDADMAASWLQRAERAGTSELVIGLAIADGARADPVQLLQSLPSALRGSFDASATGNVLRHGTLTKREVEILALVGRGRTDPEIAAALFISPKTASVHVSNIKDKLGLGSRLEVALRARELGLVEPSGRAT